MSTIQDDKILANDVLERHFYSQLRTKGSVKNLEIFLTGACKANCQYCYLKKQMHHLYPLELQNEETILQNVRYILEWYVRQKFQTNIQIFSAEWLTTPIADKVFTIIYEVFKDSKYKPPVILCADNMQFLKDNALTQKVENYIALMKTIDIALVLSASIDGAYCDFDRTSNSEGYYTKLKTFIYKYGFLPHPMLSANNAKYWIDNFRWWEQEFGLDIAYSMTILEVRNEDWDNDSIQDLLKFCDFLADETFKNLNYDKKQMLKYIFNIKTPGDNTKVYSDAHTPIRLMPNRFTHNEDKISCSFNNNLTIRAGDLTVAPCHRLFYPLLEQGKFIVKDGMITEFEPTNVTFLIGQRYFKRSCMPICESCGLIGVCNGFCHGASYEDYRNLLVPQKEVCEMQKAKYVFLIYKYNEMGLFDEECMTFLKSYYEEEDFAYLTDLINSILGGIG